VLEELDSGKLDATPHHRQQEHQGGAAGQGSGFRPTPLTTAPKPKGSMQQQNDQNDEKKK